LSDVPVQATFAFGRPQRRNIVIEAGAGTGKTTAIVAEVLRLLLGDESLLPERIILVTFTEKAAGDIADRIHEALTELELRFDSGDEIAWPIGSATPLFTVAPPDREAARRACAAQLGRIDSLRSQTIHAFCQSLLRQFPIEAGLDPQFTIIEGFERSLLYGEAYDAWIDDETRVHPTAEARYDWEVLLEHVGYLFLIRNIILSLIDRRDLLLDDTYDPGALDLVEHELLIAIERLRACEADSVSGICEYLRTNPSPPRGSSIDTWLTYLKPIANDIRTNHLPKGKNGTAFNASLRVLRAAESTGNSVYDRLAGHRAALSLLNMTRRFLKFLDEEKRKRGVVDFDDLLLRTRDVLADEEVVERVRGQFDFIFVDEFQDTDRIQAAIIDRLARDRSGAFVEGKTVVVGDPKQSIYGFRRADPETYDAFTRELLGAGAEPRIITDQYRSDPPLLAAVNAIFTELFSDAGYDVNVFRPAYHRLRAAKGSGGSGVGGGSELASSEPVAALPVDRVAGPDERVAELSESLLAALSGKPQPSNEHSHSPLPTPHPPTLTILDSAFEDRADRFAAEAESIAAWISGRGDDLRRYALLFRRTTKLDDYLDVFDRRGLAYALPPTRLFLDRPAPVDLLAVLRAIAFPFDRGAEVSAARTPYFALTDNEIARGVLCIASSKNDGLATLDNQQSSAFSPTLLSWGEGGRRPDEGANAVAETYTQFLQTLTSLRAASAHLTVSQLIDLVIRTCAIEDVYAAAADGTRSLRHLEHLRTIAFGYDQRTGGSIRQFVDEISHRRGGEPDEMEPSLVDEASNAVRILTVHTAKGLEFDTVILGDLEFPVKTPELFLVENPRSLVLRGQVETLSSHYGRAGTMPLKEIGTLREEAETRRLFYVAVTRAKSEVVFVTNAKPRKEGFVKYVDQLFDLGAAPWPADAGRVVKTLTIGGDAVPIVYERVATEGGGVRTRRRLADAQREAELAALPAVDPSLPEPASLPEILSRGDVKTRRSSAQKRAAGILLHRILELRDGTTPVDPLLQSAAAEQGVDAATIALVRKRLVRVAKSKTFLRIARAETLGRELPMIIQQNGAAVERRIDRFLREGDNDLVVDYKSGHPSELRLAADREQVARYCAAMSAITGRPCQGLIWYIDVDVDREVALRAFSVVG
jgi:ATP-dependent helicase/nuclease subunit A